MSDWSAEHVTAAPTLLDESELQGRAAFFDAELSAAMGRHRWLIEQTVVLAAALVRRRGLPLALALAEARDALMAMLNDEALAACASAPPSHSAVARLLLPQLPGYVP